MQGHRRRRATQMSPATPISPKGGGGTASISLSLLLHDVLDIASSFLRELDAVALATNVMVFLGRDTSARVSHGYRFTRDSGFDHALLWMHSEIIDRHTLPEQHSLFHPRAFRKFPLGPREISGRGGGPTPPS